MKWKPIETAPKDGRHILCYDPSKEYCSIYVVEYEIGTWVEAGGESYMTFRPTHWMELPDKPNQL